jgi:hypothetical protein
MSRRTLAPEVVAEALVAAVAPPARHGIWSFRNLVTGEFAPRTFRGPCRLLAANTPPGHEPVEGVHVQPAPTREEDPAAVARLRRMRLLAACDWVVTRAAETGQAVPDAWSAYRQALRDVTKQAGFPEHIDWPARPE